MSFRMINTLYIICLLHMCVSTLNQYKMSTDNRISNLKNMMTTTYSDIEVSTSRFNGTSAFGYVAQKPVIRGFLFKTNEIGKLWRGINMSNKYTRFIVLITKPIITVEFIQKIIDTGKVDAICISNIYSHLSSLSSDVKCPNRLAGLYYQSNTSTCNYNNNGRKLRQQLRGVPLIYFKDMKEFKKMEKRILQFNNMRWTSSYIQAELRGIAKGAVNTPVCLERASVASYQQLQGSAEYCMPLQGRNLHWFLDPPLLIKPIRQLKDNSIILIMAKIDSTSDFPGVSPGGHSSVTGMLTLLLVVKAFGDLQSSENITKRNNNKNILFQFLNGESFEHIGSSKIVYDMSKGKFPGSVDMSNINMGHIDSMLEVDQINGNEIFLHTDRQYVRGHKKLKKQVEDIEDHLINADKTSELKLARASLDELAPSSLHTFLKQRRGVPAVLLAGYDTFYEYSGSFNSHTDTVINTTYHSEVDYVSQVARLVYRYAYRKVFLGDPPEFPVKKPFIKELMECFMKSTNCSIFKSILNGKEDILKDYKNWNNHIGTSMDNINTELLFRLLNNFVGKKVEEIKEIKDCEEKKGNETYFTYHWMVGYNGSETGCIRSKVNWTIAKSPAFEIDDYDFTSNLYSTWSESTHTEYTVRIYKIQSMMHMSLTMYIGITYTFIIIGIALLFNNEDIGLLPMLKVDRSRKKSIVTDTIQHD